MIWDSSGAGAALRRWQTAARDESYRRCCDRTAAVAGRACPPVRIAGVEPSPCRLASRTDCAGGRERHGAAQTRGGTRCAAVAWAARRACCGRLGARAVVQWAEEGGGSAAAVAVAARRAPAASASIAAVWFGTPAGVATPPSPSFSAPVPFLRTLEEWASPPPHRHATPPTRLSAAFSAVAPGDRRARRQMLLRRTPRERALAGAVRRWSVDSHDVNRLAGATTRRARLLRSAFDQLGAAAAAAALARQIGAAGSGSRSTPRWLRGWPCGGARRRAESPAARRRRWHRAEAVAALGALRRHADDATTLRHASAHHRKHALGAAIARWRLILKLRFAAVAVAATRDDAAGAASAVASLRSGFFRGVCFRKFAAASPICAARWAPARCAAPSTCGSIGTLDGLSCRRWRALQKFGAARHSGGGRAGGWGY